MREQSIAPPILALVLATAMSPLALNIFLPSMPSMAEEFGVASTDIQPAVSLYFLGVAFGQLIYGPLSDRFGRRPILLIGAFIFALTNVYMIFTDSVSGLIYGRAAQAFGGCAGMVLTRAIIRDVYDKSRSASALGYITTAMVVAPALAPSAGALLDVNFGWRSSFVFLALYGVLMVPIIYRFIWETNANPLRSIEISGVIRNYGMLLRSGLFWAYMLTISFGASSFYSFVAGGPHAVMEVMGGTPVEYAQYFMWTALSFMGGSFVAGRFAMRMGLERMMYVGLVMIIVGGLAVLGQLVYGPSPLGLFGPVAFASFGSGLVHPPAMAGALSVRPQIAGSASGMLGFTPLILGAFLSEVVGRSFDYGLTPFFIIYAGACTISVLFGWLALRLEKRARN